MMQPPTLFLLRERCGVRFLTTLTFLVAGLPGLASADDVAAAARAYRQAQQADIAENHQRAAELYELADDLAPSPQALRSALRARMRAGQPGPAATHADFLLWRYGDDEESRELAERTLAEVRPLLIKVQVGCDEDCSIVVDGASASFEEAREHQVYVGPGTHELVARFDTGESAPEAFEAQAGDQVGFTFEAPSVATGSGVAVSRRTTLRHVDAQPIDLSPWVVVAGAGATVALTVAATILGLETQSRYDDYELDPTNRSLFDEGRDFQLATNVVLGATGAAAVATIVMAIFADWNGDSSEDVEASAVPRVVPHAFASDFGSFGLGLEWGTL